MLKLQSCCRAICECYLNCVHTSKHRVCNNTFWSNFFFPKKTSNCSKGLKWENINLEDGKTIKFNKTALLASFGSFFTLHAGSSLTDDGFKKLRKINLENADPNSLTYSFLIRQAVSQTVDAVTSVLMQTTLAILEADENYRKELTKMIILLEEHQTTLSHNYENEQLWDLVVAIRSESESKKQILNELEIYLQSVVGLLNKTAEVAYRSECDYVSIAASERLQSALTMMEQSKEKTKTLESDYLKVYSKLISETGKKKQDPKNSSKLDQKIPSELDLASTTL